MLRLAYAPDEAAGAVLALVAVDEYRMIPDVEHLLGGEEEYQMIPDVEHLLGGEEEYQMIPDVEHLLGGEEGSRAD